MERLYYACLVRLNNTDALLVWYQNARDGFVRAANGRLLVANSSRALAAAVANLGLSLVKGDPTEYDFDSQQAWSSNQTARGVDCKKFLDAWNFFDDLAGLHTTPTTEYCQLSRSASGCYDKLFWGNNIPAVTPPGERFLPSWSPEELAVIREVFEAGLSVLIAELAGDAADPL